MGPTLQGKVLFVFSDPGGAKPALALPSIFALKEFWFVSDRIYPFFSSFGYKVLLYNGDPDYYINHFKPDIIFTGTSYTSDLEKIFIERAVLSKITCYSLVDHWTSISSRFIDSEGYLRQPDRIWLINQKAKEIAISEGLDKQRLFLSGNPYQKWLKDWKPTISEQEFKKSIFFQDASKRILLFSPDPLSNIGGMKKYGFDELFVLEKILNIFNESLALQKTWTVFIKAHPNQNVGAMNEIIKNSPWIRVLDENVEVNHTIFYSDLIVGFFSAILLEARILNKAVVRLLDLPVIDDPLSQEDVDLTTITTEKLEKFLLKY